MLEIAVFNSKGPTLIYLHRPTWTETCHRIFKFSACRRTILHHNSVDRLTKLISYINTNWLATRKKGHSDICVKCRLGSACAIRAG